MHDEPRDFRNGRARSAAAAASAHEGGPKRIKLTRKVATLPAVLFPRPAPLPGPGPAGALPRALPHPSFASGSGHPGGQPPFVGQLTIPPNTACNVPAGAADCLLVLSGSMTVHGVRALLTKAGACSKKGEK
ncbi:hypothetical protein DIPPA_14971 [Diplonema papillatum]|nr:hypothetical protein DIPPA_14971 [Diplonema papillatum]